jgi:hypothetical protein
MDDEDAYCKYVMRYAYDLVIKSQGQEELRKSPWETLESGEKELEKYLGNVNQYAPSCYLSPNIWNSQIFFISSICSCIEN